MSRVVATLAAVIPAVAACSSSSGGSPSADPAIAFCQALDAYGVKLAALDGLTPAASVDEYKKAVDEAKTARAAVVAVAGPFVGAQLNEAETAQTNLESAAEQLPADASPAQAEEALQPLPQTLIQAVAGTHNASCNTRPTPSATS